MLLPMNAGHIHNYHTVYSTISSMLLEMGANAVSSMAGALLVVQLLMTYGIQMTLNMRSRAAEVTADVGSFDLLR